MKRNVTVMDKFIDNKCYDVMFSALSSYVEDNLDGLELDYISKFVEEPDTATLIDMEIIKTENCNIDGDQISFDTVVSCDLEIEETHKRNRETDNASQWFRMRCRANLADTVNGIKVLSIAVYTK